MITYDDYDTLFQGATEQVHSLKQRPSDDELLLLYGLYKQATLGTNTTSEPGILDFKQKAKWKAWKSHAGKGKIKAKQEYVEFVNQLINRD